MPAVSLNHKQVILGVCGGIAAYKSVELLRLLKKQQADVRVIMTQNATRFVGPLTFEALSGTPVFLSVFDAADNGAIRHIDWAQSAHAVIIAPATANMISKLANGLADDALSTLMLAVSCPVLICPSMNTHMYQHLSVQENLNRLRHYGYHVLEPDAGYLACGEHGPGRLPDPPEILDIVLDVITPKDLAGKRILVSAGPTREYIDPVRFISNPSSGKMGFALAIAARRRGADVTLVSGPTSLPNPGRLTVIPVQSAAGMAEAVLGASNQADIVIKTAAVSDYRPQIQAPQKIKKSADELELRMIKNIDILRELGKRKHPGQILVGFAAETESLIKHATQKLQEKRLDMIAGNIVGSTDSGFCADTNRVTLFYADGTSEPLPLLAKNELAHIILDRILDRCG